MSIFSVIGRGRKPAKRSPESQAASSAHPPPPLLPEQPREHELIAQVTSTDIDYPIYMAKAGSMHGVHVIRETMRYLYK